jgi:hypothetical protein
VKKHHVIIAGLIGYAVAIFLPPQALTGFFRARKSTG